MAYILRMYLRFVNQWIRLEHALKQAGPDSSHTGDDPDTNDVSSLTQNGHAKVYLTKSGDHAIIVPENDQEGSQGVCVDVRDQVWPGGFQEASIAKQRRSFIGSKSFPTSDDSMCIYPWGFSAEIEHSSTQSKKSPFVPCETIRENEELDLDGKRWMNRMDLHKPLTRCVQQKERLIVHPDGKAHGEDITRDGVDGVIRKVRPRYANEGEGGECCRQTDMGSSAPKLDNFILQKPQYPAPEYDIPICYKPENPTPNGVYQVPSYQHNNSNKSAYPQSQEKYRKLNRTANIPPKLDLWRKILQPKKALERKDSHALDSSEAPNVALWKNRICVDREIVHRLSERLRQSLPSPGLVPPDGVESADDRSDISDRRIYSSPLKSVHNVDQGSASGRSTTSSGSIYQVVPTYRPFAFNRRSNKYNRRCLSSNSSSISSNSGSCKQWIEENSELGLKTNSSVQGRDSGRYSMKSDSVAMRELHRDPVGACLPEHYTETGNNGSFRDDRIQANTLERDQDILRRRLHEELLRRCSQNRGSRDAHEQVVNIYRVPSVRPHRHSQMIDHHEKEEASTSMDRFAHSNLAIPEDTLSEKYLEQLRNMDDRDSVISDDLSDLDEMSVHMAIEAEDWFDGLSEAEVDLSDTEQPPTNTRLPARRQQPRKCPKNKATVQRNRKLNIQKFHELHKRRLAKRWDPADSVCSEAIPECPDKEEKDFIVITTSL